MPHPAVTMAAQRKGGPAWVFRLMAPEKGVDAQKGYQMTDESPRSLRVLSTSPDRYSSKLEASVSRPA